MYNKIYKNNQIKLGTPFQIRVPLNINTIKPLVEQGFPPDDDEQKTEISPEILIAEAKKEAELIVKEAGYEAEKIVENAKQEAKDKSRAIEEEAKQRGFEEGRSEGRKQFDDAIIEAELIKEHARAEYSEVLASMEADVVDVILDIARKVIGTELSTDRDSILSIVRQAFDKCSNKDNMVLKVSAEDYEYVVENRERLQSMLEGVTEFEIKRDPSLKTGSCIVETPFGSVDTSADTRFEKIEKAFREVIGK